MGLFSRKKDAKSDVDEVDVDATDLEADEVDADDVEDADGGNDETVTDEDESGDSADDADRPAVADAPVDRSNGPFDRDEVDDIEDLLDLGALILPAPEGSELRLDVDEQGQTITGVTAVRGDSAVQLQVFAAPKTSGVWDGIRTEIADNLVAAGGTADERTGELGVELHARMPARGADGRTTYSPVRFVGVDGPRWFLRAVISGRAAVDDDAATEMIAIARSAIIARGSEARAPRELLELRMPQDLLDAAAAQAAQEQSDEENSLNPFARGPEITEVR